MFYDLNIPYASSFSARKQIIERLTILGYDGAAWSTTIQPRMLDISRDVCTINVDSSQSTTHNNNNNNTTTEHKFAQFSRLNYYLTDKHLNAIKSPNFRTSLEKILVSYDITCFIPMDEKSFQYCLREADIDLIGIPIDRSHLPFSFKANLLKMAAERGICFELNYGPIIPLQIPAMLRKNFLVHGMSLVRALGGGQNLVISSGTEDPNSVLGTVRSVYDIANFLTLTGLGFDAAKQCMGEQPETTLGHSKARRIWRGVVDVQISSKQHSDDKMQLEKE